MEDRAIKVSDAMTRQVFAAGLGDSLREVAEAMARAGSGAVPVIEDDKVVGLITDHDLLRVVAEGRSFDDPISQTMTWGEVPSVTVDDTLAFAQAKMIAHKIRRLLVLNKGGGFAGILSLDDVAHDGSMRVGRTLADIAED